MKKEDLSSTNEQQSTAILWFDLFSNNQHLESPPSFIWWCGTFMKAITRLGRVVMVIQ
jgi:hypothetical protein